MTNPRYTYLQDPGHGWLLVPEQDLKAYGLGASDFTRSSYISRDRVFALEEDADMGVFLGRLEERGIEPTIVEKHGNADAPCRSWRGNLQGMSHEQWKECQTANPKEPRQ